jgi:hypothetical protein
MTGPIHGAQGSSHVPKDTAMQRAGFETKNLLNDLGTDTLEKTCEQIGVCLHTLTRNKKNLTQPFSGNGERKVSRLVTTPKINITSWRIFSHKAVNAQLKKVRG